MHLQEPWGTWFLRACRLASPPWPLLGSCHKAGTCQKQKQNPKNDFFLKAQTPEFEGNASNCGRWKHLKLSFLQTGKGDNLWWPESKVLIKGKTLTKILVDVIAFLYF
jgi:hypothetical protein